jgi:hypothetical protein
LEMRRSRVRWTLLSAAASILAAAVVIVVLALRSDGPSPALSPPTAARARSQQAVSAHLKGVTEDCGTRSEADFGPAFGDPANLVVGPLAMIGAAEFTPSSVVRRFRGQKYPLLVKARHSVTIEVPAAARTFAGLGYGPLPQGEITLERAHPRVTFIACPEGSGSSAEGPVTFWSGALVAEEPHCVPLDVFVDGEVVPRRVFIALGVRCARTV